MLGAGWVMFDSGIVLLHVCRALTVACIHLNRGSPSRPTGSRPGAQPDAAGAIRGYGGYPYLLAFADPTNRAGHDRRGPVCFAKDSAGCWQRAASRSSLRRPCADLLRKVAAHHRMSRSSTCRCARTAVTTGCARRWRSAAAIPTSRSPDAVSVPRRGLCDGPDRRRRARGRLPAQGRTPTLTRSASAPPGRGGRDPRRILRSWR